MLVHNRVVRSASSAPSAPSAVDFNKTAEEPLRCHTLYTPTSRFSAFSIGGNGFFALTCLGLCDRLALQNHLSKRLCADQRAFRLIVEALC